MTHPDPLHNPIGAPPETEEHYRESVLSPEWDVGDGRAPRLKYVIFHLARTGSVFLSAHLRRRGVGVPLEYLAGSSIAGRLGCLDEAGNTPLAPYFAQLYAKRTTPNGVFGIKIHPGDLRTFAQESVEAAADFFHSFDRVLVLLRKDKLLQAISMVRARITKQYHLYAGDTDRLVTQPDGVLFGPIATQLAEIALDERHMEPILARIDPRKVRRAWYEELSETEIDGIAAWLAGGAEHVGPAGPLYADHPLPRRGSTDEALKLKRRFLAYITGETN